MNSHTSKPPINNWLTRIQLAVTSSSNRVYPNGRQQVEVTAFILPLTSQTLKPEERSSVRLMTRDRLGRYVPLPEGHEARLPWFFSRTPNSYQEYPGNQVARPTAESGDPYTVSFYVCAGKVEPGQSPETLYVGITRFIDGEEHDYVTDGLDSTFNASVEIRTAEIPNFQVPANYTFERTLTAGNGSSDIFTWQYSLAGANVQQPIVRFHSAHLSPAGMIQWSDRSHSVTQASVVGYSSPGETRFHYNPEIKLGAFFKPVEQAKNPKAGHLTIVLQGSNNIPFDSQSAINHNGPCVVKAVDVYGNDHELEVSFKNSSPQGRLELVLA